MNSQRSIWADLPLSARISTLVCYAGVFNDVIGVEEVASRLGLSGSHKFYATLDELKLHGRLVLKDGFIALPDLGDKVAIKISKIAMAGHLVSSRLDNLKKIGKSPLIKFVGISGSVAANNPTKDRYDKLDIDVFLITRSQCLWFHNILRGLRNLFPRTSHEPELCINYILDESNSLIPNRNFYTATEIRNLIPVSGWGAYRKFLQVNNWVDYYYPGFSGPPVPATVTANSSGNLTNKLFYTLYTMLRGLKWLGSDDPLKKISSYHGINLNQLVSHCGGYQAMVQKKFTDLANTWFPELLDAELIEKLFPDQLSAEIRKGDLDVRQIIEHVGLGYDYAKYE